MQTKDMLQIYEWMQKPGNLEKLSEREAAALAYANAIHNEAVAKIILPAMARDKEASFIIKIT